MEQRSPSRKTINFCLLRNICIGFWKIASETSLRHWQRVSLGFPKDNCLTPLIPQIYSWQSVDPRVLISMTFERLQSTMKAIKKTAKRFRISGS
jgi:hypothetical protein